MVWGWFVAAAAAVVGGGSQAWASVLLGRERWRLGILGLGVVGIGVRTCKQVRKGDGTSSVLLSFFCFFFFYVSDGWMAAFILAYAIVHDGLAEDRLLSSAEMWCIVGAEDAVQLSHREPEPSIRDGVMNVGLTEDARGRA